MTTPLSDCQESLFRLLCKIPVGNWGILSYLEGIPGMILSRGVTVRVNEHKYVQIINKDNGIKLFQ